MAREHFDIIVVGAGHAGVEAAYAGVRLGKKVLLVTTNLKRIGYMSCNPSIGGLGKGHMVREIDILGGLMGQAADATCIQFKRLNSSKGPAVRGTRMQSDKDLYVQFVTQFLKSLPNLTLMEGEVKSLVIEHDICRGVRLHDGSEILSKAVIITTGTFLNAVMHTGLKQVPGGRVGDKASQGLSDQLKAYGFEVKRLKTGTPARLDRDSIRWDILEPQWGDPHFYPFSLKSPRAPQLPQIACYISRTNPQTHDIIRSHLHLSPMYAGIIEGVGPRYCPSIEDKIVRFADRDSHQTFLEPEGLNTNSIYLQGISTSLPEDIQLQFLKTIPGLENVRVLRFGYAVEYDFVLPTQIYHRLETRAIKRLFLAGQINGTSGYEEAAVQGLLAGINACHVLDDKPEIVLGRHEAYAGVLIDDLVTKGTQEPYRMLTSRAEHRLVLREDNVVDRLGSLSLGWGLASGELLERIESLKSDRAKVLERLRSTRLTPVPQVQELLLKKGTSVLKKDISFEELLRRPELTCFDLEDFGFAWNTTHEVAEAVEIEVKYQGYIKRQQELIEQSKKFENKLIPEGLDFSSIKGLSTEEVEKLSRVRPRTLGQASRISGVSPSAIQCLMIYLKNQEQISSASLVP
jgi:tRNA uridine 5-carboxymethylaminomethyl modification enzyme